jgi:predicted AlkP superfamily pyrophosphatase or phosphodiesterase
MRNKVILIILDGLNYQVARDCMGFLHALTHYGEASLYKIESELPSNSRPLYECILTGVSPVLSGICHNGVSRNSNQESVFSLARNQGLKTAAAAYHWISELYNRTPFDPLRDRFTHDEDLLIQHGCFYSNDAYPDDHLFIDAEWLRAAHDPDFLLIHPMSIDAAGHRAGVDSAHYRNAARHADTVLSDHLPRWINQDYQILITADHGMNADNNHGGVLPEEREVPLYTVGSRFSHDSGCEPRQTDICGNVCELLGLEAHAKSVTEGLIGRLAAQVAATR